MTDIAQVSAYSTILFIDSMVVLEGKPLSQQPWSEIDSKGPILILVVPQVSKEIDKRKRDGRLGKRAREFNRLIAPAAESAAPIRLIEGPPQVDIGIAITGRIDWDALDDLDPDDSDSRVVAQILNARGVPHEARLLFSQDTNPISMAARHGLRSRRMPDHWLLEPEPGPNEKELSRLKGRVNELEAKEPDIQFDFVFGVEAPVSLHRITPLSAHQKTELINHLVSKEPKIHQDKRFGVMSYDGDYDEKYERFKSKTLPTYAARIHRRLELHYNQVPFVFTVQNKGHVQAENLIIALSGKGGRLHDQFVLHTIFGPIAPKPELFGAHSLNLRSHFPKVKDPVGRHEMEFAVGPNRGDRIEVHCQDFRHGSIWEFRGIVEVNPYLNGPYKLNVTVTASNQRGIQSKEFDLPFVTSDVVVGDLVDLLRRKRIVDIPMQKQFNHALESEDKNWFEFVTSEDDELDGEDT